MWFLGQGRVVDLMVFAAAENYPSLRKAGQSRSDPDSQGRL
jgi:hypothetical protein